MRSMICVSLLLLFVQVFRAVSGSADVATERGMRWCGDFCLCPDHSNSHIQCLNASNIYAMLEFGRIQVMRLNRVKWNPITALKWCNAGNCFCNKETDKQFACSTDHSIVTTFIDEAVEALAALQSADQEATETPILRTAGGPPFSVNETVATDAEEEEASHRRRDSDEERRNRRRNRKNRKNNKRRNRNDGDLDEEVSSQEIFLSSDDSEVFDSNPLNDFDYQDSNLLPRQEAINSNPMVTAMQPPTRRQPIFQATTQPTAVHHNHNKHGSEVSPSREVFGPQVQESSHPDFQHHEAHQDPRPSLEVPVQRKTVAGRVSEDLKQITEDVQHIRSDVVFNQRILLVTVGVAGVAMLGVLILALHACCSRRSSTRRARITENGRHEDSHHLHHPSSTVTKVNIDEAW